MFRFLALKYAPSRSIFSRTNRLIEKLSEITVLVIVKVTPISGYLPWFVYTFFVYFTTDLGNAAFDLPFPIWWVHKDNFKFYFFFRMQLTKSILTGYHSTGETQLDLWLPSPYSSWWFYMQYWLGHALYRWHSDFIWFQLQRVNVSKEAYLQSYGTANKKPIANTFSSNSLNSLIFIRMWDS